MIPVLFSNSNSDFTKMGIGALTDTISCVVKEVRNGKYELILTYPISGRRFDDIRVRRIIKAKPNQLDPDQFFRIYKITKPTNGIITVYASHLSYDLNGYVIPENITGTTAATAVENVNEYCISFNLYTDIVKERSFKTDVPRPVRYWLSENKGSLQKRYGGIWHWNNYDGSLLTRRGTNRGTTIRYGKNLAKIEVQEMSDTIFSDLYLYYQKQDKTIIDATVATGITLDTTRMLIVETNSHFEDDVPTVADLEAYAIEYMDDNNVTDPYTTIQLDYYDLDDAGLNLIGIDDTVQIYYENYDINVVKRCIETNYDVLLERHNSVKFGDKSLTLTNTIRRML